MMKNKFNGQRLKEALQFRGMRMTELAKRLDISKQSLSLYANDENIPPFENVQKISKELHFPLSYFMTEDFCRTKTDNTYFRSQASASKLWQNAQKIKLEYVAKIYEVFLNYVDFPVKNLPPIEFNETANWDEADEDEVIEQIEKITGEVRNYWKMGMGPIDNMQYLLESNGIIVTGFKNIDKKIDAFSQRINVKGHGTIFVIALAIGVKSDVRLRFDMCHELGHILLHNWDDSNDALSKEEFNAFEKQANIFASALLLPKESFGKEVAPYATNVEYYRMLKKRWGVSMQAMMYRSWQLGLITANQFQYMMRTISAKGWRLHEPGDATGVLNSTIFQSAVDVLLDGGYVSTGELLDAFHEYGIYLSQEDLEDIMCLRKGTLKVSPQIIPFIKVKK